MGELILLRHGETEWSAAGRHTGRTNVPLTAGGEAQAAALARTLARRKIQAVFTSPAERAVRTAKLAGLDGTRQDPGLWEWDYGGYEGRTTAEIRAERPGWYLWRDGVIPGDAEHPGETVGRVGARADAVLGRVRPLIDAGDRAAGVTGTAGRGPARGRGDVVLVGHGHMLRVLAARWLGLPPADGRLLRLDTGTYSTLGTEHDLPVITGWNIPPIHP
jgi:probable phosphoglycerate mutase